MGVVIARAHALLLFKLKFDGHVLWSDNLIEMKNGYFNFRTFYYLHTQQFIIPHSEELKNSCRIHVPKYEKHPIKMKTEMEWFLASMLIIENENENKN